MIGTGARSLGYGAGLFMLVVLGLFLTGQAAGPETGGLPADWSHQHLIFSRPATDAAALALMYEPRYWQQWNRINLARSVQRGNGGSGDFALSSPGTSHSDWSRNLGSGAAAGAGVYPAKYSFQITSASCGSQPKPDYVVFGTGLLGSSSQASVVGFDNLYSGCGGTVPNVYWAFNTGARVLTSPTVSRDGSQVAFVQTNGGIASLVLLKWAAGGTVTAPVTLVGVANTSYRGCTAPCMTTIVLRDNLGTATDDTTSSVFPDYAHDIIWVGGGRGWLQKITGAFVGTPTRVTSGGFPAQVKPSNPTALTSPVYDSVSGNVYVGDAGGFFYRVSPTGVVTASGQVDFGAGLVAGPIVDSTAGRVYVFSSSDGTTACTGASPCTAVYQFTTAFAAGTTGTKKVVVGNSRTPTPNPMYSGGFDSQYFASANATGSLYVCGNTGGAPTLYQIPISANVMGTVVTGPALTSAATSCSPVTDISNPNAAGGTSEWLFAGVKASGLGNSCAAGGCVMNYVSTPWVASTDYAVGQQILDTHFQVEVCRQAGTSRATAPVWSTTVGATTADNTVRWVNQGPQAAAHPAWLAAHAYTLGTPILDSNGNIQVVSTAGTSAAAHPVWSTTLNAITADNTVRWREVGLPATASLAEAGGTGGIIIDNVVGSGTLAGASQIYFATQSNQVCGAGGTGGCAVQASQSSLQ